MEGKMFNQISLAELMTSDEVRKLLKVSDRTLYSLTSPRGPIRAVRIGRSVRYHPDVIQAYLQGQLEGPPNLAI